MSSTNLRMFASSTCARGAGGQQPPCGSSGPEGRGRAPSRPLAGTGQYLGLVVQLVPVARAPAAHGAVVQQQHGHLQRGTASAGEPGGTSHVWGWPPSRSAPRDTALPSRPHAWDVAAGTRSGTEGPLWHGDTLANSSSSPSRSFCADTRFSVVDLCLQSSATRNGIRAHTETPATEWIPVAGFFPLRLSPPTTLGLAPCLLLLHQQHQHSLWCCGMGHGTSPPGTPAAARTPQAGFGQQGLPTPASGQPCGAGAGAGVTQCPGRGGEGGAAVPLGAGSYSAESCG